MFLRAPLFSLLLTLAGAMTTAATNARPRAAEWAALAERPDLSGVWVPDVADQRRKERGESPPWTAAAKAQIDFLFGTELPTE